MPMLEPPKLLAAPMIPKPEKAAISPTTTPAVPAVMRAHFARFAIAVTPNPRTARWRMSSHQPAPPASSSKKVCESETLKPKPEALAVARSEEHTSELQSRGHLVCRLLLEKKK